jgi:hypothetical protein
MRHYRGLACIAILLVTPACAPLMPTPGDFPPPPWTQIIEFPTLAFPPTAVPRPMFKPIQPEDMDEARTLLLLLQVGIAAGDSGLIAERVLYPIEVPVNGQPTTIASASELVASYDIIFHPKFRDSILRAEADDVRLTPYGVEAADGALWFNQFCTDSTCTESQFLITAINN